MVDAIVNNEVIANAQASTVRDEITLAFNDLRMERYDDEDEGVEIFSSGIGDRYYQSNEMDPYLIDTNDVDDDELEDMIIYPTDSAIVSAASNEGHGFLLVWIYEDRNKNLYVHHQIDIEEYPLCMAWLDCPLKEEERGNFLAVGSMLPSIEIWDLDVIEEVNPCVVLVNGGHTDSAQGLAWNKEYRWLALSVENLNSGKKFLRHTLIHEGFISRIFLTKSIRNNQGCRRVIARIIAKGRFRITT